MRTLFVTLLLLASVPLLATPSGLTWIPDTDIQTAHVWHLDSDTYIYSAGLAGATADAPYVDEGVLYGVTSRVEVGADYAAGFANAKGDRESPLLFNAKYQVLAPSGSAKDPFTVSVGTYSVSPTSKANAELIYGVASIACHNGMTRFTAGGYTGRKAVIGDDNSGALVGAEQYLDKAKKWWLSADFQSGSNLYGALNAGLGYYITPNCEVLAGYDHYNKPSIVGANSSINVQIDINL